MDLLTFYSSFDGRSMGKSKTRFTGKPGKLAKLPVHSICINDSLPYFLPVAPIVDHGLQKLM